jgi:hypothetical protein
MRLAICMALTGLLQLVPDTAERPFAWLSLLGRQSLVGYIASVELTYGATVELLSWRTRGAPFQRTLSFGAMSAGIVVMVGVTWGISLGWERSQAWRKARAAAAAARA